MKILVLSSRLPFPPVGGDKVRIYSHLNRLALEHDVTLFSLTDKNDQNVDLKNLENKINIKTFYKSFLFRIIDSIYYLFFSKLPLQVGYFYSKKIQKCVDKNYHNYDLILCYHIRTTQYVVSFENVIKIVDLVDLISLNLKSYINTSNLLLSFIYSIESKRVEAYEKQIIKKFNKSALISKDEIGTLDKKNQNKLIVLNNYIDIDSLIRASNQISSFKNENYITFFGKMNYKPNIDAINWFSKQFLAILNKYPKLKLVIIGGFSEDISIKFKNNKNIIFTGFVENPYSIISDSILMVAPMVSGSGIQNKIIESMAIGKTVITTEIGASGLNAVNHKHLVISTLSNFKSVVCQYIEDSDKREYVNHNSKKWITENYSEINYNEQLKLFLYDNIKSTT